jgi:hypothetical protein
VALEMLGGLGLLPGKKEVASNVDYTDLIAEYVAWISIKAYFV